MKVATGLIVALLLYVAAPVRVVAGCGCDCDDDGAVSVAELIRVVNITLGNADVSSCRNLPPECEVCVGPVTGLIRCVGYNLRGCPTESPATPSVATGSG